MGCLQPYFKVVISSSDNIYFYFYFIFSFAVNGSGTFLLDIAFSFHVLSQFE